MIDISEVRALTREALRSLEERQPAEMKRILDRAADEERRTHEYNNITWHLQQLTFATALEKTPDGFEVELGARTHYASIVADRGRSRIVELAERAANEVEFYFDGEADRLGSL